jgi:fibronectin-binding autotransporter adhesin
MKTLQRVLEAITVVAASVLSPLASAGYIITGTDAGPIAQVKVFDGQTTAQLHSFLPYGAFTGGVRVAGADVTGDGVPDIITGAGPGPAGGHVKVFDGVTGVEIRSFLAYPGFTGGVFVAGADVNGDGVADIITGAGSGTGGHVKVFSGSTGALLNSFLAYPGFAGGVSVGGGDVNGNGFADMITGAGPGHSGGHVKVFDGAALDLTHSFFAYPGFTGGVFVAAGDVNGDGLSDLVTGAGPGHSGGHVKVFDAVTGGLVQSFFAFQGFTGGVYVGAGDLNGDGLAEIVAGAGPGHIGGHVKVFDSSATPGPGGAADPIHSFFAYPGVNTGVFVAAASFSRRVGVVSAPSSILLLAFGALLLATGSLARTRRTSRCSG